MVGLALTRPTMVAAATPPPPTVDELATKSLTTLKLEVAALIELDGLADPLPDSLEQIYEENRPLTEPLSWEDTVKLLHRADNDGSAALEQLRRAGVPVSDAVVLALSPIPAAGYSALDDGNTIAIDPIVYVHAINDLRSRNGALPGAGLVPPPPRAPVTAAATVAPTVAPPTLAPTTVPAKTVAAPTVAAAVAPAEEAAPLASPGGRSAGSSAMWLIVAGAAGALVSLLALVLGWRRHQRRRHGRPSMTDGSVTRLLDAGRRMTGAFDSVSVASIAAAELKELVRADSAASIRAVADAAEVAAQCGEPIWVAAHFNQGLVGRVMDTGQPQRSVLQDPAFGPVVVAALAVPLVIGGRVEGALLAVRDASEPFTSNDQDVTAQLAAVTGSALEATARHDDVSAQSLTDGLTSLANRRRLDRDLPQALSVGTSAVGLIMIDVDHFKTFNDTHGHLAGDGVLCRLAEVLQANVRAGDVVYRYGGEEFCVLVPHTDVVEATEVAERLRAAVAATDFAGGERQPGGRVTISLGLAMANQPDPERLAGEADAALYQAKRAGRNRLVVHLPGPEGAVG
ncbi:MAG: hypothetical protein JWL70_2838 [Acidimicrobiia bacterium]|nr:hypothetical protein [Acidimicrobiia bacterium]